MIDVNPNQPLFNPAMGQVPAGVPGSNVMFVNQPGGMYTMVPQTKAKPSPLSRIGSLHLPAIILFAFSWILHTLATFLPYWSTYSGYSDSRAGLWSARNFDYYSIQNFYFPQPTDFPTVTSSIRFTSANTKAYIVTVQFLMTFNFVTMFIVLVLLIVDYMFARQGGDKPRSFLMNDHNTSDTAIKYGLLLYILYIFVIFEFAAWITYVGSRHDNGWQMHVSFAFAVIVSAFLIVVFVMYVLEFLKRFKVNRLKWDYWYGPYVEWGFFVYLSALLLLLIVICCPEWAYAKEETFSIFAEIGLFKQCYLSAIYKKQASSEYCTLSNTRNNQAWVNAAQAFMLMAYIFGMIILVLMVIFRKEFRHNATGYDSKRFNQPMLTYIIAGLILFFCFIFTLIGISIFGGKVFPHSLTVNWGYILAVIAMVLFLVTGILFILDAVHSKKQTKQLNSTTNNSFFFPAPLSNRVVAMQPLLKPEPAWPPQPPPPQVMPSMMPMQTWQPMYPPDMYANAPYMPPPPYYPMEPPSNNPITQATLANYYQMLSNPQLSSIPNDRGLMNYSPDNPPSFFDNRNETTAENYFAHMTRRHFLQQQRLNYNHERLLEKYSQLRAPRVSQFRAFGTSALPGRNYDQYLDRMRDDDRLESSLVGQSRARIGASDDTYRWMGEESFEPLPRGARSLMQHSRNDPMPFVQAEKFEPVKMYHHPVFGPTPAYIRPLFKNKKKHSKRRKQDKGKREIESTDTEHEPDKKMIVPISEDEVDTDVSDRTSFGYVSYKNWKTKHDHLVPVDPLLFNIYTQRSNGSIESYGQSLYVPSVRHNHEKESNYYDGLSVSRAKAGSISDDAPDETSVASKHRYNKLQLQPTISVKSQKLAVSNSSNSQSHLSPTHSTPAIIPSSLPSTPLTPRVVPPPTSSAAKSEPLSSSTPVNAVDASSVPSTAPPSRPLSVSSSTVAYQTLSSIIDNPSTAARHLESTTPSHQRKAVSHGSTTDDDEDDNEEKKKRRGENETNNPNLD